MSASSLLLLLIGSVLADDAGLRAAAKAAAALERYGPHVARYARVIDGTPGEVVLEVTYRSPRDISLQARSGPTRATLAIDTEHARIRVEDQCAVVAMEPLLRAVEDAGVSPDTGRGKMSTQLDYRLTDAGEASMEILFQRSALPAPLGWLVAMGDDDATVRRDGRSWQVDLDGVSWWISRKTGLLERMSAGEDEQYLLAQVSVAPLADGDLSEAARCPESSDDLTTAMFTSQLLWEAYSRALPSALPIWRALEDESHEETVQRQRSFWRHYFQVEMKSWEAVLQNDPIWRAQLIAGMGDVRAYTVFTAQLPPEERPDALLAWQQVWFANAGRSMVSDHISATEQMIYQSVATADPQLAEADLVSAYILSPMTQEALAAGEALLVPLLRPVIEQGAAQLEVRLTRP